MSEYSWLWDGTTTGDASLAPYAKEAFTRWFLSPRSNDNSLQAYALPGYLDDLLIKTTEKETVSALTVKAGAAVVADYVYVLTEDKHFPIQELSLANYRYDSLIFRVTRGNTPRVTLLLVPGNESTVFPPTPYAVVQEEGGEWEIEVARVLIDSAVYTLDGTKAEVFLSYLPVLEYNEPSPYNCITNSEWCEIGSSGAAGGYISGWTTYGGAPTPTADTALAPQSRGQSVNITGTADIGYSKYIDFNGSDHNIITIAGVIRHNDSTTRTKIRLLYAQEAFIYSAEKQEDVFGFNTEDTHFFTRTFDVPADVRHIRIIITGTAATNDFNLGQFVWTPGYCTGSHRPFHEYIGIQETLQDASWDGDAKSSGTTTVNLSASFGGLVPRHVKAVLLEVRCRDSASAAGVGLGINILSYTSAWQYGTVVLDGVTNNYWKSEQIVVYINEPFQQLQSANRGFRVQVTASGAGTLDAYIEITGIIV